MKLDGFGGYEPGGVVIVVLHVANIVIKLSVACPRDDEVSSAGRCQTDVGSQAEVRRGLIRRWRPDGA
jgi:hypothetical protein